MTYREIWVGTAHNKGEAIRILEDLHWTEVTVEEEIVFDDKTLPSRFRCRGYPSIKATITGSAVKGGA